MHGTQDFDVWHFEPPTFDQWTTVFVRFVWAFNVLAVIASVIVLLGFVLS